MSVKLTVIYDNPKDPAAFERHYRDVHMPIARKIPSVRKVELAKVFPKEDGSPTPAYRTADLYFDSYEAACAAIASAEGQAAIKDALALATGGVRFLLSDIEPS
ncbi:MAG: EthD family reductase [Candidatus Eremiobacteraeota bacterium]|nr:EthD family reductase [Candidatus Eremiobacteraeota bacterium]